MRFIVSDAARRRAVWIMLQQRGIRGVSDADSPRRFCAIWYASHFAREGLTRSHRESRDPGLNDAVVIMAGIRHACGSTTVRVVVVCCCSCSDSAPKPATTETDSVSPHDGPNGPNDCATTDTKQPETSTETSPTSD